MHRSMHLEHDFYNKTPGSCLCIQLGKSLHNILFLWGEGSGVPSPMGIEHSKIPLFDHSAHNWCLMAGFLNYPVFNRIIWLGPGDH